MALNWFIAGACTVTAVLFASSWQWGWAAIGVVCVALNVYAGLLHYRSAVEG